MQTQTFMPVMHVGTYSFQWGDLAWNYSWNVQDAPKTILGSQEQTEPTTLQQPQITFNGWFKSELSNQALLDAMQFMFDDFNGTVFDVPRWRGRPVIIGKYSQDSSSLTSSIPIFCGAGLILNFSFDTLVGKAAQNYQYNYRFTFKRLWPVNFIQATNGSGDQQTYTFPMTGQPNGYVVGVMLCGTSNSCNTNGLAQTISSLNGTGSINGPATCPALGSSANQLFSGNTQQPLINSGAFRSPVIFPLQDSFSFQSLRVANPLGNWTLLFGTPFNVTPNSVQIIYYPN